MRADCDLRDRERVFRELKESCKGSRVSAVRSLLDTTGGVFIFWCVMPLLSDDEARIRRAGVLTLEENIRNSSLICHPGDAERIQWFLSRQSCVRNLQELSDTDGNHTFLFEGDAGSVMRALRGNDIRGWTVS